MTVSPGLATRYAREKLRQGCALEHELESDPDGLM
jgi:hypothetical protein